MGWGSIYDAYNNGEYAGNIVERGSAEINDKIVELVSDDEITAGMSGIYKYIITGDGTKLQIRQFEERIARAVYEKQNHHCPYCEQECNFKEYAFKEMQADHIMPWSKGARLNPTTARCSAGSITPRKATDGNIDPQTETGHNGLSLICCAHSRPSRRRITRSLLKFTL